MHLSRQGTLTIALVALTMFAPVAPARAARSTFTTVRLPTKGRGSGTEPRVAVGRDDRRWVITSDDEQSGTAAVFSSTDGTTWTRTATDISGQTAPTIDVDVVVTPGGRVLGSELDTAGLNFPTAWTDDNGKTWHQSTGTQTADQDRQWFTVGKEDPQTHKPRVYMLYHNLASGLANHNM